MFPLPPAGELYSGQEKCRGEKPDKKEFMYVSYENCAKRIFCRKTSVKILVLLEHEKCY
jgi:hypothetical protein